jgi:hypothetical protein
MDPRRLIATIAVTALITALLGCNGESKTGSATGPRITGGTVDTESRPEKPGLGGAVEAPK